jgi:hypothetical protein
MLSKPCQPQKWLRAQGAGLRVKNPGTLELNAPEIYAKI